MNPRTGIVEPDQLISIFLSDPSELGTFESVPADDVPDPQRSLLDHNLHMTVTVEKFHRSPVEVDVLQHRIEAESYSREILLRRRTDGQVVQYGIVRLDFRQLEDRVRAEIERREKPLGRILIDHEVLRRVQLLSLYRIVPNSRLASVFQVSKGEICFGRTAIIHCNNVPAIELLEVVRV